MVITTILGGLNSSARELTAKKEMDLLPTKPRGYELDPGSVANRPIPVQIIRLMYPSTYLFVYLYVHQRLLKRFSPKKKSFRFLAIAFASLSAMTKAMIKLVHSLRKKVYQKLYSTHVMRVLWTVRKMGKATVQTKIYWKV